MTDVNLKTAILELATEAVRDRLRLTGIYIDGVEVTQSIQYRAADMHLTDAADRGPDNSVRLVADKPARVRVYVRTMIAPLSGITGTVTLQKRRLGLWTDAGTLTKLWPLNITAEPAPDYAAERGSLWDTLNFVIPAAVMRGRIRLKVEVRGPGEGRHAETTVEIDASLLQTLKIRGIPVRYDGPDAAGNPTVLPAPTLADFQTTAVTTLRMFPVSQTPDISLAGVFSWNKSLLGAIVNGQCPKSWNDLLFWLGIARVIDGNKTDSIYYALLPNGIPTGGASGCGGGSAGVGAGSIGDGMAMAHEIGHVLGFPHAPCGLGAGDTPDASYPAYEPYDTPMNRTASIGEYGMDATNGTVYPPNTAKDFMSYCGPNWISLYHMQKLMEHPKFNPRWVSDGRGALPPYFDEQYHGPSIFDRPDPPPPWVGRRIRRLLEPNPEPQIIVTGQFEAERIDVQSVLRLPTGPASGGERIEDTFVELLDANRRVLQRVPLRRMALQASCSCCDGGGGDEPPSGLVQAQLPDVEGGQLLRVVRGEEVLWSREAPRQRPDIREVSAEPGEGGLVLRWRSETADAYPVERAVRWSADRGATWQVLALRLDQDTTTVPMELLTSGAVLLQVVISDGFHGAMSEPISFDVPARPPALAILWPVQGSILRSDDPLRLWGVATASDGTTLPSDALCWFLDGEPVGNGSELWVPLPEWDGEHRATLKVRDADCQTTEVSVTFHTSCSGRQPIRSPVG